MTILIVDDEKMMREDLKSALERVSAGNTYHLAINYDEAMHIVQDHEIDIAFLDVNMPGKSGLEVAKALKKKKPQVNIVIVTAHEDYALSALRLFVSGYMLKPVMDDELREILDNLRMPVDQDKGADGDVSNSNNTKKIKAKCFGNFEIFYEGKMVSFSRQKEKELLAYLICLKGSSAGRGEICANLFEESDQARGYEYLKKIVQSLKKDLEKAGLSELFIHNRNSYAVNVDMLDCDYYDYISGKEEYADSYRGEFMNQYSWAEVYIYALENY